MDAMTVIEMDSSALSNTVAFTGRLACMSRAEAFDVVREHGGTPSPSVTRHTNVLIVGELGWPLLDDGRPSNKLSKAGTYGIPVVSERRFLEWIGKAVPDALHRTYSADQIAALSKLPSSRVGELVRFGLLNPRDGLFGFRDLASARQISKLFDQGIALSEIIRSVQAVREWLPEADLSNLRLHPSTGHAIEIEYCLTNQRDLFLLVQQSRNNVRKELIVVNDTYSNRLLHGHPLHQCRARSIRLALSGIFRTVAEEIWCNGAKHTYGTYEASSPCPP